MDDSDDVFPTDAAAGLLDGRAVSSISELFSGPGGDWPFNVFCDRNVARSIAFTQRFCGNFSFSFPEGRATTDSFIQPFAAPSNLAGEEESQGPVLFVCTFQYRQPVRPRLLSLSDQTTQ